MANNRLLAVCRKCKKFVCIAKYYPSGGWANIDNEKLKEFENKHQGCSSVVKYGTGDYVAFVTETDERVKSLDYRYNERRVYLKKGV